MWKRFSGWLDRLRPWYFLYQLGTLAVAAAAAVSYYVGLLPTLIPQVAQAVGAVGIAAVVFLLGYGAQRALPSRSPKGAAPHAAPDGCTRQQLPTILSARISDAQRRMDEECARLLNLASEQQRNWGEYICVYVKAVDFDGIEQNEASITVTYVLVNRTVYAVSASDLEIQRPRFWVSREVHGVLRPLTSGHQSAVVEPGKTREFKHDFPLNDATTAMLRELDKSGTEIHFELYPSWQLNFPGVDTRWQTRAVWIERPRRSWERQQ